MAKTTAQMEAYVLANYKLVKLGDQTWEATSWYKGDVVSRFVGPRVEVVHKARCWWGHFNFECETRAFNSVFS